MAVFKYITDRKTLSFGWLREKENSRKKMLDWAQKERRSRVMPSQQTVAECLFSFFFKLS